MSKRSWTHPNKQDTQAARNKKFGHSQVERDNQLSHFMDLVLKRQKGDIRVLKGGKDRIKAPFCHQRMKTSEAGRHKT